MKRVPIYDKTLMIAANDDQGMRDAAKHLASGEVVGFPTETVYGLGANAFDDKAVDKIFLAKGRPGDNPLIVHVASKKMIPELVAEITPMAQKLIDAFMPGPITVIMRKSEKIPGNVTAGIDTVGIRMPSDPVANRFLTLCGCPVAAPSANLSGSPSPTKAIHVLNDMDTFVYAIVDGGESTFGLESTVVDATGEVPAILRPGAITKTMISDVLGIDPDVVTNAGKSVPKAPGMKYRHYAPVADVDIIDFPKDFEIIGDELSEEQAQEKMENLEQNEVMTEKDLEELSEEEKRALFSIASPYILACKEAISANPFARIGLFVGEEIKLVFELLDDAIMNSHTNFYVYGKASDVSAASHGLFDGLRVLDMQEVNIILAPGFQGNGLSRAYMNRLLKASGKKGETVDGMPEQQRRTRMTTYDDFENIKTFSVLFVCDNNKNLSCAAEAVLTGLFENEQPYCLSVDRKIGAEIYCESAGLFAADGEKYDNDIVKAVEEVVGRKIGNHVTRRANPASYDDNDLIFTMRDEQTTHILEAFPELKDKVFSLSMYLAMKGLVVKDERGNTVSVSIPDPEGETHMTYVHTVKALKAWLLILLPYILNDLGCERA